MSKQVLEHPWGPMQQVVGPGSVWLKNWESTILKVLIKEKENRPPEKQQQRHTQTNIPPKCPRCFLMAGEI